jgi:peptidoglycan/LPS O-acetylase OafA/YrhL
LKKNTEYRPDIDGIRALAVLSVFIFHLHPGLLPGGFLGVDIFFVISGYLITGIIVRENSLRTFSFARFYARRIKRIFPALFVVLLLSGIIAILLLPPETYKNFMDSARYASGQLANIFFSRKVDYFSEGFSGQPLLHTWSLGVEEQFYLFWPLLIFGCYKLFNTPRTDNNATSLISSSSQIAEPRSTVCADEKDAAGSSAKLAGVFFFIYLGSFALCYTLAQTNQNLAFYMFYSRAFEFCIGGFVALKILPSPVTRKVNGLIGTLGLLLLCYSLYFIEEEHLGRSFLQFGIVLPCVGTALIIHANGQQSLVNKILATTLPTAIGKISYSLYLYHWPAIAFWKIFSDTPELKAAESFGIIAVTFLLSVLSYFLVEKPARKSTLSDTHVLVSALLLIVGFAVGFKNLVNYDIASWRISPYFDRKTDDIKLYDPDCTEIRKDGLVFYQCQSSENIDIPVIALVGDSHSPHYLRSVTTWAKKYGHNVKFLGTAGCPMLLSRVDIKSTIIEHHERQCEMTLPLLERQIVDDPRIELILIAQRFDLFYDGKGYLHNTRRITFQDSTGRVVEDHTSYYYDQLSLTVDAIRKAGKDLVLLKQVPLFGSITSCNWEPILKKLSAQERSCSFDTGFNKKWQQPSIDFIDRFAAAHQVETFDPVPHFAEPLLDGISLYKDKDHLNEYGSLVLAPSFEVEMNAIVARKKETLWAEHN